MLFFLTTNLFAFLLSLSLAINSFLSTLDFFGDNDPLIWFCRSMVLRSSSLLVKLPVSCWLDFPSIAGYLGLASALQSLLHYLKVEDLLI
ncbi:hypothetical protein LXL04_016088 [Taraxacum kok-saghyz]